MSIFKLKKDELYNQWHRNYYEIEAETIEEAVQMIKDNEVDPYDFEPIYDYSQVPIETEILDWEGNILYESK